MYLGQQKDHASSPTRNSTPTDQQQRKTVGQSCLAGNVGRPGIVSWYIEVVAVMRRWRSDGRNPSGCCGAWPCIQLYIMMLSLYATRLGTQATQRRPRHS